MPWTKQQPPIVANVNNNDLTASFCVEEGELVCNFVIACEGVSPESVNFPVSDATDLAVELTPQQFLIACRDYALPLAGYTES